MLPIRLPQAPALLRIGASNTKAPTRSVFRTNLVGRSSPSVRNCNHFDLNSQCIKTRNASHLVGSKDPCTGAVNPSLRNPTLSLPDFNDPRSAHGSKSLTELVRAIGVLNMCQINILVDHSSQIIEWAYRTFGTSIVNAVLRPTFYKQFCAGEDSERIQPTIAYLRKNGIESILDYCAENAPDTSAASATTQYDLEDAIVSQPPNQPARIYKYTSEKQCDRHRNDFLSCIRAVRDVSPHKGFAALKVTALGNPQLLERMSAAILGLRELFVKFDRNRDGKVTKDEFEITYRDLFVDAHDHLPDLFQRLDPNNTGLIDFISWSKLLSPSDLPRLTAKCRSIGPLSLVTPSDQEIQLLNDMHARAHTIAAEAAHYGTRMLFDAEQTWFQPAIDNLVLELQQTYNDKRQTDFPIIFNTYQCYLKDTPKRLMLDVNRSERFGYHFGAKLVRGAYINSERKRANDLSYASPIHDAIEETHECYDGAMLYLLTHHSSRPNSKLEVMCATHNQTSVEKVIELMDELQIPSSGSTVHFAQLLGMSDNLSFTLGKHGYSTFKYVPYGKVEEAIPYLLRRAIENRDMLKNNKSELQLMRQELGRRVFG